VNRVRAAPSLLLPGGPLHSFLPPQGPFSLYFSGGRYEVQAAEAAKFDEQKLYIVAGAVLSEGRTMRRWDVLWAIYNEAFKFFDLLEEKARRRVQLVKLRTVCSPSLHRLLPLVTSSSACRAHFNASPEAQMPTFKAEIRYLAAFAEVSLLANDDLAMEGVMLRQFAAMAAVVQPVIDRCVGAHASILNSAEKVVAVATTSWLEAFRELFKDCLHDCLKAPLKFNELP
jgi:hypothetical protein